MNKNLNKTMVASLVCGALYAGAANGADFYFGEDDGIHLQVTSQLSMGASWRLKDANPRFIGELNGGTGGTTTTDDGNLNFGKNDTFSKIIKGSHDIQLSKDNYGFFARVKYWYDKELKDESRPHGHSPNGYTPGAPLNDDGFADFAKFSGIELMDAYFYSSFDVGQAPVEFRLGRQVISWGESTFIQGGLNSTNPFDVNALRRPGAELKEGLLPVGMAYINAGVSANLTIEAFYQYEWEKTQIDGCGTYFSGADFAADGCFAVTIAVPDRQALAGGFFADRRAYDNAPDTSRRGDDEPDDGGQYGFAFRYYAAELNDTEFGLYFMNLHSRLPLINSIRTAIPEAVGSVFIPSALDPTGGALSSLNPSYRIVFPEDLQYYGASFATNIGGTAVSGEISYKPDTPIQINGPELLNGVLSESPLFPYSSRVVAAGRGEEIRGYDEFDVTQMQVTALHFFERVLGASRLTVIGEAGIIFTDGIEDADQRYGRNSVFGLGDFDLGGGTNCTNLEAAGAIGGDCEADGYVTDTAWGYRIRGVLEYTNVFAGISLKPTIDWQHDVNGYSPDPGQQFNEGAKSFGVSLEALYQQKYSMTLGYRAFSGGSHNILEDKDFLSLNFAVSY
ncbi:DUF1302 domain-containing protein [Brumicola nitratireducens]|uniref:DUF1302 domain-containing protein n=1 Tax=Glaciecola nitratireducens (strain JCM 12485 / KCTC 12276 / FR1064) TaxID=1085623 RepID=G4QN71_GLANF|nr:DUF1302 domain-containing protein [Glaciecola nitratireducens]AEP31490.1 hypothetical protein GNIT_3396 [Glaciecola nitratireducens FR1064]